MARSQVRYHVPLGNIFGTRHFRIMGFMLGRQIYRPPKENTSGSLLRGLQKWYWGLADSFNPTKFEPAEWAAIMKDAGFKYLIFTTKHHDGFCMFDSKYTDYSIAKVLIKWEIQQCGVSCVRCLPSTGLHDRRLLFQTGLAL